MSGNSDLPSNGTFRLVLSTTDKVVFSIVLSALAVLCAGSNFLVCFIIAARRRVVPTASYFIFSLALTDISVGLFCMPMFTFYVVGRSSRALADAYAVTDISLLLASVIHLCLMSIDRVLAVAKPLYHRRVVTKPNVVKILIIPWATGLLSGLTYLILPRTLLALYFYFLLLCVLFYALPIVIIITCYVWIFREIRIRNKSNVGKKVNEIRLARSILVIILTFIVCWTPFIVISRYNLHRMFKDGYRHKFGCFHVFIKAVVYLSSTLNPFIYAIFHPRFRARLSELWKCCRKSSSRVPPLGEYHATHV